MWKSFFKVLQRRSLIADVLYFSHDRLGLFVFESVPERCKKGTIQFCVTALSACDGCVRS
jgi:hypothetical protein